MSYTDHCDSYETDPFGKKLFWINDCWAEIADQQEYPMCPNDCSSLAVSLGGQKLGITARGIFTLMFPTPYMVLRDGLIVVAVIEEATGGCGGVAVGR